MGQVDNDELRTILTPYFLTRNDFYSNEICRALSMSFIMTLPALRGFWPGSVHSRPTVGNHNLVDVSGNGQEFVHAGNPQLAGFGTYSGIPNVIFNGSDEWYSIADSAHWDILGTESGIVAAGRGLTMGAWIRHDDAPGSNEFVLSKRMSTTNMSYWLNRNASGFGSFAISDDGTSSTAVTSSTDTIGADTWTFLVGRFDPSTEMKLWVNDTTYTNVSSIPASIFNGAADLFMAGRDDAITPGQALMDGRTSMAWICAANLDDRNIYALYEISRHIYGV